LKFFAALFASVSRLHIVAIATLGALTFGWLFTGKYLFGVAAIVALDWFLVNLLNRVADIPEDVANNIFGTREVEGHARAITIIGSATLVISLVLVHFVLPAITPFRIAFHALGVGYNLAIFPGKRRIKQMYFWKNVASATGFLLTVFCYPIAAARSVGIVTLPRGISVFTIAIAGVFFFLFELSFEVIYDLRDIEGDALANARTYPVVHGEKIAVRIVDALIIGSMAALVIGFACRVVPWRIFVMIFAPAIQLVVYKRALRRGITSQDCIRITWLGAALLASYNVWIALHLPGIER
jgi:4-hydroxybenzoate polyprenyltransferase